MHIFIPLLVRLLAVAVICLAGSVVWSMTDARIDLGATRDRPDVAQDARSSSV